MVTVDHPHDSYGELPGGRLAVPDDVPVTPWDHARDIRFGLARGDYFTEPPNFGVDGPGQVGLKNVPSDVWHNTQRYG